MVFVALVVGSCTRSTDAMCILHISLSATVDLNLTRIEDCPFGAITNSCLGTAFSCTFFGIPLLLTSQSVTRQQILLLNDLLLG